MVAAVIGMVLHGEGAHAVATTMAFESAAGDDDDSREHVGGTTSKTTPGREADVEMTDRLQVLEEFPEKATPSGTRIWITRKQ
mmetsp:Transcript_93356/g.147534  ORF Transcript_93356/g.147534 Transcript_93356/m.147534 type:complete len:83 (+) Transcript_93356:514-762(+)